MIVRLPFCFSDKAAIGVEISGKSRFWFEYHCDSKFQAKGNITLIVLYCKSSDITNVKIPEESTVQCLKTVEDPKKRLVKIINLIKQFYS